MTSYGLTITDKCVATPAVCELRWGKCFGCNGDGTRTVPLDRDAIRSLLNDVQGWERREAAMKGDSNDD